MTTAYDLPDEITLEDRLHEITVDTEYKDRYQSESMIRDLPGLYIDEPRSLGGFNSGPTALETTLAALNACSAMIMHIVRMELTFEMGKISFHTTGTVDSRRVEMKKTKKKYSEIEPVTRHYRSVRQEITIASDESGERWDLFTSEVHRLCPMHALLDDAGVPVEIVWRRAD
jgi:uncharacterized OsmC-like protein